MPFGWSQEWTVRTPVHSGYHSNRLQGKIELLLIFHTWDCSSGMEDNNDIILNLLSTYSPLHFLYTTRGAILYNIQSFILFTTRGAIGDVLYTLRGTIYYLLPFTLYTIGEIWNVRHNPFSPFIKKFNLYIYIYEMLLLFTYFLYFYYLLFSYINYWLCIYWLPFFIYWLPFIYWLFIYT